MMKKILAMLLVLMLCAAMFAACTSAPEEPEASAEPEESAATEVPEETEALEPTATPAEQQAETFSDVPLEEVAVAKDSPDYYKAAFETEFVNYKLVRSIPTAYSTETWSEYMTACARLPFIDAENIGSDAQGFIDACISTRESLEQVRSFADSAWFIWGDSIPCAEDTEGLEFTYESWDYPEFKPFLVPYLLEDQSTVKGNMIVVAGGGYSKRSNTGEGYPIAARFNELGYNCYVLQRRVAPYSGQDTWMDLQRSIRYLRYYAEQKGIGGMDLMLATGFSGGAGTISGTIVNCYGTVQPTLYDATYQPDAVDTLNSDLDVALIMYGPFYDFDDLVDYRAEYKGYVTENENLPSVFIAVGSDDSYGAAQDSLELYKSLDGKTLAELHIFGNASHGFGLAQKGNNTSFWVPMADGFVDMFLNLREKVS